MLERTRVTHSALIAEVTGEVRPKYIGYHNHCFEQETHLCAVPFSSSLSLNDNGW